MAEPQIPEKNLSGISYRGQQIEADSLRHVPLPRAEDITVTSTVETYVPEEVDFFDIQAINRGMLNARRRLHIIRNELRKASRVAIGARYQYESEKKRKLVALSGGDSKTREALADLMTEELQGKAIVAEQVVKEITQHSRDIRTEVEVLVSVANNLRREAAIQ